MNIHFQEMVKIENNQVVYLKNKKTHIIAADNIFGHEILCGAKLNKKKWSAFFSVDAHGYIRARRNLICKNCLAVYNRI